MTPRVAAMGVDARRRSRRKLVALLAPLLGLLLADIGLGIWYGDRAAPEGYPWPPYTPERHPEFSEWIDPHSGINRRSRGLFDPELGWANRPSTIGTSDGEGAMNSIGARGSREYAAVVPEGVLRLGCFGESYTFGSEVSDSESWPAQLEGLDRRLEAVNFGLAAYGLDQSLLCFRRHKERIGAQVIVIGIQVGGIGRNVARSRFLEFPASSRILVKPRFRLVDGKLELVALPFENAAQLLQSAQAGELLSRLAEHEYWRGDDPWIPGSTLCRLLAGHRAAERRDYRRLWADVEGEPFQVMLALLESFRSEALAAGARAVLVIVFPDPRDRPERTPTGVAYLEPFRTALAERQFDVIDLDRELGLRLNKERKQMFVRAHFSAQGNGVVARKVLAWLHQQPALLE